MNEQETIKKILGYKNIAVVGLSSRPERPSYGVAAYMQRHGYNIIPVNPTETEVLGQKCYPSLADIPADIEVDIVDVFRKADQTPPVVDEAIARGAKAVWLQLGIANEAARQKSEAAGLLYVEDRCIKIEHAYYR